MSVDKPVFPELPSPYFWRVVEVFSSGPACIAAQIVYPKGRRGRRVGVWSQTLAVEAKNMDTLMNHARSLANALANTRMNRILANRVVGEYGRKR